MSVIDFLVLLAVAGICGALGQAISGYSRGGCLVSIAIGFIGAVIGVWLARKLDLPEIFALNLERRASLLSGQSSARRCLWRSSVCCLRRSGNAKGKII